MNLTKKEFALQCGIKTKHLSTYIARGKILINSDDTIDPDHELNQAFQIHRGAKVSQVISVPLPKSPQKAKPHKKTKEQKQADSRSLEKFELDKLKTEADVEKKLVEIELLKAKKAKLQGQHIPTELALAVIVLMAEGLKAAYMEASERLIVVIGQKQNLSSKDIVDIRTRQNLIINQAIESSANESKKGIARIVKEYSATRGVGESA